MTFLTELRSCVDVLSAHPELDVEPDQLLAAMRAVGGDGAAGVLSDAAAVMRCTERAVTVASAVISELSARDRGHGGFAATKGHRSPVSLVQSIAGGTRADAVRAVRLGESLLDAHPVPNSPDTPEADVTGSAFPPVGADQAGPDMPPAAAFPWHYGLGQAMLHGAIEPAMHDAILKGLGHPPVTDSDTCPSDQVVQVWAIAAEQLLREAQSTAMPAEELLRRARTVRDVLDPVGAEHRFQKRFDGRSFRTWVDGDGTHHGHVVFDDEMAAWVLSMISAGLRPRRGGPRFVDGAEHAAATVLTDDPRSNEQLSYDLLMDVLRAGALAEPASVFGARQPGVRMIVVKDTVGPRDAFGRLLTTGHLEDGGDPISGSVLDRHLCEHGSIDITVDRCGNPLNLGRDQRLFTPAQRIALAARDGGCMWPGCGMPASYCEAHHKTRWEDGGNTDIDDGILLCRFHHMTLHANNWRITRDRHRPFVLHPPPGTGEDPIVLRSKAAWQWAWDPAPDRRTWRAA